MYVDAVLLISNNLVLNTSLREGKLVKTTESIREDLEKCTAREELMLEVMSSWEVNRLEWTDDGLGSERWEEKENQL